jgi:hypothetical protein
MRTVGLWKVMKMPMPTNAIATWANSSNTTRLVAFLSQPRRPNSLRRSVNASTMVIVPKCSIRLTGIASQVCKTYVIS